MMILGWIYILVFILASLISLVDAVMNYTGHGNWRKPQSWPGDDLSGLRRTHRNIFLFFLGYFVLGILLSFGSYKDTSEYVNSIYSGLLSITIVFCFFTTIGSGILWARRAAWSYETEQNYKNKLVERGGRRYGQFNTKEEVMHFLEKLGYPIITERGSFYIDVDKGGEVFQLTEDGVPHYTGVCYREETEENVDFYYEKGIRCAEEESIEYYREQY